jgi:peptidyl-prolyl cis-trans isomerase D
MLKLIHQNSKIITYVFLFVAVCFMFSSVTFDFFQSQKSRGSYALKVNEEEISYREYERTRQNIRDRYRKMLGDNFDKFITSFNLNISRQALDSALNNALLSQEASALGFVGSDDKVSEYLVQQVFAGQAVSKEGVRGLLQSLGMNFKQFSEEIKEEIARAAYINLLRDVSVLGKGEIVAQYARQNTLYSLSGVEIITSDFEKAVSTPADDVLRTNYQKTATEYEQPAKVSYDYYVFSPSLFEKDVVVAPQDVEFYYSEHQSEFKVPEQAHVRAITLLYPKSSDPKLMADVKTKAQQVHSEALSGKPFQELVAQYSEDLPTKLAGGDKGWLSRGNQEKEYDDVVFAAPAQSVAELIETNYGFEIVYVEERKDASVKPLDAVRTEIELSLRRQDAPSYASAKAHEILMAVSKSGKTLAEVVSNRSSVKVQKASLLARGIDPSPLLKGLTQQALQRPVAERIAPALHSVGDTSVLFQVTQYKEATISPFEEVRDAVISKYKEQQAKAASQKAAQEFLQLVKANPEKLSAIASEEKYKVVGPFSISRAQPSVQELSSVGPDLTRNVFTSDKAPRALDTIFRKPDGFFVGAVERIQAPDTTSAEAIAAIQQFQISAKESSTQQALTSTIAMLKSRAVIDIDESILAQ